jgi:hypothetical protein
MHAGDQQGVGHGPSLLVHRHCSPDGCQRGAAARRESLRHRLIPGPVLIVTVHSRNNAFLAASWHGSEGRWVGESSPFMTYFGDKPFAQNPSMKIVRSWSGILAAWVLPILLNMNAVGLVTVETMMMFRFAPSHVAFPDSPCIPGVFPRRVSAEFLAKQAYKLTSLQAYVKTATFAPHILTAIIIPNRSLFLHPQLCKQKQTNKQTNTHAHMHAHTYARTHKHTPHCI